MQEEIIELREKVAAFINSNDHLKKENIKKEVKIIIQAKNISEMEGDRSCWLRQHIGSIIEKKSWRKTW